MKAARDAAVVSLCALGVADLTGMVAYLHRRVRMDALRHAVVTPATLAGTDRFVQVADASAVVLLVAAAVTFATWLRRGYDSLHLVHPHPHHTPRRSVSEWLLPWAFAMKSKEMAEEMWDLSAPAERDRRGWPARVDAWALWCWFVWVLSLLLYAFLRAGGPNQFDSTRRNALPAALEMAVNLVAVVLTVLLVHRLTARIDRTLAAAQRPPGAVPAG